MAATYDNLVFKTALDAQWAAFFDLAHWEWRYNPAPIDDWQPDFRVTFPCGHSECAGSHILLVSVLPTASLAGLLGHPALRHAYGARRTDAPEDCFVADAGAVFGIHPGCASWTMAHGAGGGGEVIENWVTDAQALWIEAAKRVNC